MEQEERWNIIIIITTDYWRERHTVYANISLQIDRWDGPKGQERVGMGLIEGAAEWRVNKQNC